MSEVLMDRLGAWEGKRLPKEAVAGILAAMADGLDDAARNGGSDDFGIPSVWRTADRALPKLLKELPPEQRSKVISRMFAEGKALGWLAEVMRDEIFAHGHFGQQAKPDSDRLLSGDEFREMLATMLRRFAESDPATVLDTPHLAGLLFGWVQGARDGSAKKWVEERIKSDDGLLDLLSRVRGWSNSSGIGVYHPLRPELSAFLDVDAARQRVNAIRDSKEASIENRKLAAELATAFDQGFADRH